ncbi:unnamed protein product [Knipowitschia caucasica]
MGAVTEGEDVLARWTDGLLYLGNVKRVDGLKQCCLVRFEDNSEFWVLRKDIHTFAGVGEDTCCLCDGPALKDLLVTCLKCRHGYHVTCHCPPVDPEVDQDSWICRHCVFAVATKRGGAMKRGRFARLMQYMKLRLPYQLSALDWDPQHLTNQQQCYCYCAGPGEWHLKMLQCARCGQWFHEACTQCLSKPLLYGDRFYEFECSVCTKGLETIQRLPMTWVDLAHLVLYHLSLCCKRKYFDFDHEILSFAIENWESLLLGALSDTPRQERCHHLLNALNEHKDRFVSGKEIKKKKCLFGLQVRAPPPLASDSSPVLTEAPVSIAHRKSPLSVPCSKRVGALEYRKPKRRLSESQTCPAPVDVAPIDCLPCCHGYMGGTSLCNRRMDQGFSPSPPSKRMMSFYHNSTAYSGSTGMSRTHHYYNSAEEAHRTPAQCLQYTPHSAPQWQHQAAHTNPLPLCQGGLGGASADGGGTWGSSEAVRILARRVTHDGKVQYLVEWENVGMY